MGDEKVFIRHPDEFPIELNIQESQPTPFHSAYFQLVCRSSQPFHYGDSIAIKIPSVATHMEVKGTIESCKNSDNGYEIGIGFNNEDALMRIRMLEQLCYIQRYRAFVQSTEGRALSEQDAAIEWIGKYAHLFPV